LEKISSFDFEVVYIPGTENVVADALSRMYSNDALGTVRARSEYTYFDVVNEDMEVITDDLPILAGIEAVVESHHRKRREIPPAETGRPETSREFASRVRDHFVLRGPDERKEGGIPVPTKQLVARAASPSPSPKNKSTDTVTVDSSSLSNPKGHLPNLDQPTLVDLINSSIGGIDLLKEMRGKLAEDALFKIILDKPDEYRNFKLEDGLLYLLKDKPLLCIPKLMIRNRSIREIVIAEGHSLLAHLGASKMLDYLRDHVWWPDMVSDVKAFCETCVICKRSKPSNQKPYSLLNPLKVPGQPWESIGVDFVGPLPASSNRNGTYDCITVIICLLTSMVHLLPSRSITTLARWPNLCSKRCISTMASQRT
jgi:hypothetical protein